MDESERLATVSANITQIATENRIKLLTVSGKGL
jgi:hypothetical protein